MIPGQTPGKEFVAPWSGDDQLASVAQLVRRYHDAAAHVPAAHRSDVAGNLSSNGGHPGVSQRSVPGKRRLS